MKKILFFALIALGVNAKAQITFEHDYDSASTISLNMRGQLMIINFETLGEQYVNINRTGENIKLYNLNHSLNKTISLSGIMGSNPVSTDVLYLSEHLFNTDDKIEFMIIIANDPSYYTGIYNEDGTLIFSESGAAMIKMNVPLQQYPIYNTSQGTKMILSYTNGHAKVFSLPGTLSTSITEANAQLVQMQNGQLSNLYPNPSNGAVTLQYELPKGEQQGELVLFNMLGKEVKRYKVDNTFKDILLDNTQLPAGTYFYQLQTIKGMVGTKKMVIIK